MDPRSAKRKRYSSIKNLLVNDLLKLTVDSNEINTEMLQANEDFKLFFKSMEDRQSQHLSRMLLLEEAYTELNVILNEAGHSSIAGSTSGLKDLPTSYAGDIKKFVGDSVTSMKGNVKMLTDLVDDMSVILHDYGAEYNKKVDAIKSRLGVIDEERTKLMHKLDDYVRSV